MTFVGVPVWLWGVLALLPAIVFVFVHPRGQASGLPGRLLRWGHPMAWSLVSSACFTAVLVSGELAYYVGIVGVASFLGFFGAWTTLETRDGRSNANQ